MWRWCGELTFMWASRPPRPLDLVANSTLRQLEKLSSCVQPCHAVVNAPCGQML
jgi:hypothetical protein